jgi:PIN like domain
VVHLTDRSPPSIDDRTWMAALGDEGGWVVISGDRDHRNRIEPEAWRRSGLVVFFLGSGWRLMRHVETAWRLLRWWPRIEEQARLVTAPAAFEIPVRYGTGRFSLPTRLTGRQAAELDPLVPPVFRVGWLALGGSRSVEIAKW